ncbi:hypothetical protein BKA61DRAFT_692282 [Leptodontidium sp. MPI-SDFR-AT-0119]|nr:hypothetical protein BKA61DRAFT_692282 [Leptodontidium sp. MPI-SDFR-AT-0119]
MYCQSFILYLFGYLAVTFSVAAKNGFNANFPKSFSFIETKEFFWGDGQGIDLISLFVLGNTNQTERYELPLDPNQCKKATIVDNITNCIAWLNNGTATFGGDYARGLVANRQYHIVLNFVLQSDLSTGSSESSIFQMLNPVTSPSTSSSKPPTSTSRSAQPQPTVSTSPAATSPTPSSTSASRAATTPNPSPTPSPTSTPKTGLTPGAKAGITIGVLSVAATAFLAIFFLYRKRQAKKEVQSTEIPANRNTAVNLDDISITLGSPVTYDRVYEGRQGWYQRQLPSLAVPRTPTRRGHSQQELNGSPF